MTGKLAVVGTTIATLWMGVQPMAASAAETPGSGGKKKIVFVAGPPSHGYGAHEHNAGCLLLAKCLKENVPGVQAVVYRSGWPKEPTAFDAAAAIVVFCDGGGAHVLLPHLDEVDRLIEQGVGLACLHYAVQVSKGKPGEHFLDWIGGYYELWWSVNPHWRAKSDKLPKHPVTRGVRPFAIDDEWYYHMRFRKDLAGVTPVLTATPPDSTRKRPDGPHSGNKHVRARMGMPEHVAWVYERPEGGRGFGFTGGHWHRNWAHDDFRKLVLNAIVWVAGLDVPPNGVHSQTPTIEDLEANQDESPPRSYDRERLRRQLARWNEPAPKKR